MTYKYYDGTSAIINLSTEIGKQLGIVTGANLAKPKTKLRKENQIRTIHASLQIEGNTLTLDQVSALLDNKRVFGPMKDIKEVQNAIKTYSQLHEFDPFQQSSYAEPEPFQQCS